MFLLALFLLSQASVFAATDDTSIIDELSQSNTKAITTDVRMKTVQSCKAFEDVMEEYMKDYWENNQGNFNYRMYGLPVM